MASFITKYKIRGETILFYDYIFAMVWPYVKYVKKQFLNQTWTSFIVIVQFVSI